MKPKKLLIRVLLLFLLFSIVWIGIKEVFYEMALFPSDEYVISLTGFEEKEVTIDMEHGNEECLVVSFDYEAVMDIEIIVKEVGDDYAIYHNRYQSPFKKTHREMLSINRKIKKVSFRCISNASNSKVNVSISKYGSCF